jgi:hypothetical protein
MTKKHDDNQHKMTSSITALILSVVNQNDIMPIIHFFNFLRQVSLR